MTDWNNYYTKHAKRKPREQVLRALNLCIKKDKALDIGSGTLAESALFLEQGFKQVVAVDKSVETKNFANYFDTEKFSLHICDFKDFDFIENNFDIINAQYSLPFYGKNNFVEFIETVKKSLKNDGVFVGQFFGDRDGWNIEASNLAFQNKEEVLKLLEGLDLIEFIEEEKDGKTAAGNDKHWHVFHFIAKK